MDHHDERLHEGGEPRRRFLQGIMFPVPAGGQEDDNQQQQAAEHQGQDILGDADVQGPAAVGFDDLSAVRIDVEPFVLPFFQVVRREDMPAGIFAVDDDRKRNGNRFVLPVKEVPFIGIPDMAEDDSRQVHLFLLLLRPEIQARKHQQANQYEPPLSHSSA